MNNLPEVKSPESDIAVKWIIDLLLL